MALDETRPFLPVQIALLTVSDTRTLEDDRSGDTLQRLIEADGHVVVDRAIEKDDADAIEAWLNEWISDEDVDVVISTGGTGITGRDVTPEAFARVLEKTIDGFGEMFRWISYQKIGTSALQSRALGGVSHGTYLFALPGSTGAVKDGWQEILRHQLDNRFRPCNLVELMPRLREHEADEEELDVYPNDVDVELPANLESMVDVYENDVVFELDDDDEVEEQDDPDSPRLL